MTYVLETRPFVLRELVYTLLLSGIAIVGSFWVTSQAVLP